MGTIPVGGRRPSWSGKERFIRPGASVGHALTPSRHLRTRATAAACNLLRVTDGLSPLEREVIATILAPEHPVMYALRRQFERCHVTAREMTGVGFFTTLAMATHVPPAPVKPGRMHLGDVTATIEGLEHGAGFVLFVRDGVLDTLEGYSFDEPWPDVIVLYEVSAGGVMHSGGSETDMEQVGAAWTSSGDVHEH
jgi:hypothetical protein